jgi:hypothetical protein
MNRFYFNPNYDIIYVSEKAKQQQLGSFLEHNDCGLWGEVQSIALGDCTLTFQERNRFPALRTFTVVHTGFSARVHENCEPDGLECDLVDFTDNKETSAERVKEILRETWSRNKSTTGRDSKFDAMCPDIKSMGYCKKRWGVYTELSREEIQRFRILNPSPTGYGGVDQTSPCTCASPAL